MHLAELRKGQETQPAEKEEKKEPQETLKPQAGAEKKNNGTGDKDNTQKDKPVEEQKAGAETEETKEPQEPVTSQTGEEKTMGIPMTRVTLKKTSLLEENSHY